MDYVIRTLALCLIISNVCAMNQNTDHPHNHIKEKDQNFPELRKRIMECTEESKVDPDIVLKLRSRKWKRIKKEPPALKKWALCLLNKSGMMSLEGVLHQDAVLKSIPAKDRVKAEKVIDKCLYKKHHTPPDVAWHYIRCFRNNYSKYSLL